jgi:hypothetical protein
MALRAQQVGYRQDDLAGNPPFLEVRPQRGTHVRVLYGAGNGNRESVGIRYPRSNASAPVQLVTIRNAIDPGRTLRHVKLGRIFQVSHPPLVHLLGDPAFVADVGVTAALVEGGEDPLYLGQAAARGREPGTLGPMGIEVCRGLTGADLRQPGSPRLEPAQHLGRCIHPILRPTGDRLLLQVGGGLGAAARFYALPERQLAPASLRTAAPARVRTAAPGPVAAGLVRSAP